MQNNAKKKSSLKDSVLAAVLILAVWQGLTFYFPPLILPGIQSVLFKLAEIFSDGYFYSMIGLTVTRMLAGITIGVSCGLALGLIMGFMPTVRSVFMPVLGIMQTVPPVSWVILALVWFGFNGLPVIFIIIVSSIPIITINVCEGFAQTDPKLMQMAFLYRFSYRKKIRHIILPSIAPDFKSALRITLGTGWKIAVMGEVLTANDGIGGMIKQARLNIEPDTIIAWSVVIVVLFYLSDFLLGKLMRGRNGAYAEH